MIERHRHATVGRVRRRHSGAEFAHSMAQPRVVRRRGGLRDLYSADTAEARGGGRFRWFFSTCLAAAVGSVAIVAALFGASDPHDGRSGGGMSRLRTISSSVQIEPPAPVPVAPDGLAWAAPKSDRLEATTGAMVTRYIVQDSIRQRRGSREYIQNKPYARVLARLVAVRADAVGAIPAFNPIRLYGNATPIGESDESPVASGTHPNGVAQRVVELLGSILPTEDGQELDAGEVTEVVERARAAAREALTIRPGFLPDGVAEPETAKPKAVAEPLPSNTTVLEKTGGEQEDAAELEGRQTQSHKVGRGDTLTRILQQAGADPRLARGMVEAARGLFIERDLSAGFVVDLTLEPSLANPDQLEPIGFAIYDDKGNHRVSVERSAAGEFQALATPLNEGRRVSQSRDSGRSVAASLYAGVYQAALSQNIDPEVIQQILRLHAHETDFRRRARVADELELFFDLREEGRGEEQLGELLFSGITAAGESQRLFRFRANDGTIDYYDEDGNNSRKFLVRRPIRTDDARITSGFGVRLHPLLNVRKGHTGIDWAAPIGTPIMATGNGVIEEAGPKGQYGNYVRIRHANGYQTAYAHMSRYAAGVRAGVKVRQSQIIGYVGNTGFSTGPHVHYEVLVNNQFVDPLSIQVPRERRLTGRQLAEFQKERARIEDLLRRQPIRVEQISGR